MILTKTWRRIPRPARLLAVVGVPLIGAATAGVLVVSLAGFGPDAKDGRTRPAAGVTQDDQDTPSSGFAGPLPQDTAEPPAVPAPQPPAEPVRQPPGKQPRKAPDPAAVTPPAGPPPAPDPTGGAVYLEARLDGPSEVGAAGDRDGRARAVVRIVGEQVCFSAGWDGLAPVTGAHLHTGVAGANGPVRIALFDRLPATLRLVAGCVTVAEPDLLARLAAAPAGYYVNLHTAEAPAGAVRGQLAKLGHPVDLLERVRGPLLALATGDQETPHAGDPDGGATGFLRLRDGEVHFGLVWRGIAAPTDAHVHAGPVGTAGEVVFGLFSAADGLPGSLFAAAGVAADVRPGAVSTLARDPARHYLNVHTRDFPKGAVRGQVFRAA